MGIRHFFKNILLLFFFLSGNSAFAQAPVVKWDKTFGGNSTETKPKMIATLDGCFILGGDSWSGISGNKSEINRGFNDFWIVKIDSLGTQLWDKTYGGNSYERLTSIIQCSDGGFLLGGDSHSDISGDKTTSSKGNSDFWIIKIDSNGNKIWDKSYGGNDGDGIICMEQTSDGGYILGGYSTSGISFDKTQPAFGLEDYWVIKIDLNGNKLWDKTYGGIGNEWFTTIKQTSEGGFILGGYTNSPISGNKTAISKGDLDFWVLKIDSIGGILWDKTFGGNNFDKLEALIQTSDKGFLLGGTSFSNISGDKTEAIKGAWDFWILKVSANGIIEWDKTLGSDGGEHLIGLIPLNGNTFLIGGQSNGSASGDKSDFSKGKYDYWVIKINSTGTTLFDKTIGSNDEDYLASILQTSNEDYILAGWSLGNISSDKTQASRGDFDFWIVKLGPDQINSSSKLTNNSKLSIYPNPTTSNFTLQLTTNQSATATLTNSLGQQIENRKLTPQNGQITEQFNTKGLAKGIYTLAVTTNQTKTVKKIVVQ